MRNHTTNITSDVRASLLSTVMPAPAVNNTTTEFYGKPSPGSAGLVGGLVTFYALVTICAIGSNITILVSIIRRLVPRNTVNVFFSSLAVSDLVMALSSWLDCFAYLNGGWSFGESTCKIQSLLLEVSFTASTLTLVAVSCERYLLICHPQMKRRTIRNIYNVLLVVWIMSFLITSPLLHGYIVYEVVNEKDKTRELVCANKGLSARDLLIYYSTYSFVTYVIPLIIMAFTHWRISLFVRDNHRRQKFSQGPRLSDEKIPSARFVVKEASSVKEEISSETSSSDSTKTDSSEGKASRLQKALLGPLLQLKMKASTLDRENKRNDRRIRAVRMLFVVTVTFFLLWSPFIILRVVVLAGTYINTYVYKLFEIVIFSSTAVNAFIYAYMSPPFRRAFKSILCCQDKGEIIQRYAKTVNTLSLSEETSKKLNCTGLPSPNPSNVSRVKFDPY